MKKIIAVILCVVLCAGLYGCDANAGTYNEAVEYLNSNKYEQAIDVLEELASLEYKDSADLLKTAKYKYVKANYDNQNQTTFKYLKELQQIKYRDSASLYDELYKWKATIIFTDTQKGISHEDKINATRQMFPFYFIRFMIQGGTPGAEYRAKYEIQYGNGQSSTDYYWGRHGKNFLTITLSATERPIGNTTFILYDEQGNVLASKSSYIY